MEFLRDPLWQFIGVVVAVIALCVSILFYLKQQNIKRIAYEIVSDAPVFSIKEEVKDKIQVLYNERQIADARLVVVRIWNSGNASVLPSDYESPIQLDFGKTAEILDMAILRTSPESLKDRVSMKISSRSVILIPLLLNRGDMITLRVLLSNYKGYFKINARIAGIKEIAVYDPADKKEKIISISIISIIATFIIISLIFSIILIKISFLYVSLLTIALIFVLIGCFITVRSPNRNKFH